MSYSRIVYRAELISAIFIIAKGTGTVKLKMQKISANFAGGSAHTQAREQIEHRGERQNKKGGYRRELVCEAGAALYRGRPKARQQRQRENVAPPVARAPIRASLSGHPARGSSWHSPRNSAHMPICTNRPSDESGCDSRSAATDRRPSARRRGRCRPSSDSAASARPAAWTPQPRGRRPARCRRGLSTAASMSRSSQSVVTSKYSASATTLSVSGLASLVSHLLTACRDTPSVIASSSCDRPRFLRRSDDFFSKRHVWLPPCLMALFYRKAGLHATKFGWKSRNLRLQTQKNGAFFRKTRRFTGGCHQ